LRTGHSTQIPSMSAIGILQQLQDDAARNASKATDSGS
jgi:hypothetical protein